MYVKDIKTDVKAVRKTREQKLETARAWKARKKRESRSYDIQAAVRENRKRFKKMGMTPKDYYDALKQQLGICAICSIRMLAPHIDHDHTTGKFRGLLCNNCNRGIGLLGDSKRVLRSAIDYLRNTTPPPEYNYFNLAA